MSYWRIYLVSGETLTVPTLDHVLAHVRAYPEDVAGWVFVPPVWL